MGLREDEPANGASGRWTRSLADLPLTERSPSPQFADLVSVDIPELRDFKTHSSNWDTYERRDFNTWFPRLDFGRVVSGWVRWLIGLVFFGFLTLIAGATSWQYRERLKSIVSSESGWMFVFGAMVAVFALITWVIVRGIASIDEHEDEAKRKKRGKGPARVEDIAGQLSTLLRSKPLNSFLERHRVLLVRFGFTLLVSGAYGLLNRWLPFTQWGLPAIDASYLVIVMILLLGLLLVVAAGMKLYEISFIPAESVANARAVWVGNGQIQFGCGPKGISVEHHRGFLYLIRWAKIELIYDNEDLLENGEATKPFDQKSKLDEEKGRAKRIKQVVGEQGVKPSEWAKGSLRIRLKQSGGHIGAPSQGGHHTPGAGQPHKGGHYGAARDDHDDGHDGNGDDGHGRKGSGHANKDEGEPFDEIIVPKRFFGDESKHGCDDFHRSCWLYKWADEEASRKAAITILRSGSGAPTVHPS